MNRMLLHVASPKFRSFLPSGLLVANSRVRSFGRPKQPDLSVGRGTMSWDFSEDEHSFLATRAIPFIVNEKIRQAVDKRRNYLRFGIKALGIGQYGSEFGETLDLLFEHLVARTDFAGAIAVECTGIDVDLQVLDASLEYISGHVNTVVGRSPVGSRVQVSYSAGYGDLTNRLTLPAMLAFGYADVAIWRWTHILSTGAVPLAYGESIVAGMRRNLQRPGALIVAELAPGGDLLLQEYK